MTSTYAFSALLVFAVVRQLRGRRLAGISLYLPLAVAAYVGARYLHTIPTAGNDLDLVVAGLVCGATLGLLCGATTAVYVHSGVAYARATVLAAALWIGGVAGRLAFALYAEHGGGPAIARFSAHHALTGRAWVAAFVLMALAEVATRSVVLVVRGRRVVAHGRDAIMAA